MTKESRAVVGYLPDARVLQSCFLIVSFRIEEKHDELDQGTFEEVPQPAVKPRFVVLIIAGSYFICCCSFSKPALDIFSNFVVVFTSLSNWPPYNEFPA